VPKSLSIFHSISIKKLSESCRADSDIYSMNIYFIWNMTYNAMRDKIQCNVPSFQISYRAKLINSPKNRLSQCCNVLLNIYGSESTTMGFICVHGRRGHI